MSEIDLSQMDSDGQFEDAIVRRIGQLIAERSTASSFMSADDASLQMSAFMERYADTIHRMLLRERELRRQELARLKEDSDHD